MGRLIDADEYEKRIKPYDTEDAMDKALYNFAHEKLITTPTAQPKIIRCKDCVNWDVGWSPTHAPNYHYCPLIDCMHKGDFYCAYGEVKK